MKGVYEVSDRELAAGSTLGSPKAVLVLKATGAVEKLYSPEAGADAFGALTLHYRDARTGIALAPSDGKFVIRPHVQEHHHKIGRVAVATNTFVLNTDLVDADHRALEPPAAYFCVELRNDGEEVARIATTAELAIRPGCAGRVEIERDDESTAFVACSDDPKIARIARWSIPSAACEVASGADPIGVARFEHRIEPGERVSFDLALTFSVEGEDEARRALEQLPAAREALERTEDRYAAVLRRAIVLTPDDEVNRGALWAKANVVRCMLQTQQGWCFVNDPARTNNSVGRDTAWFVLGADYFVPQFTAAALEWYAEHATRDGMYVEFYDVRNGKAEDYGLNVNDDTPLLVIAFYHHFCVTGDRTFLERVYESAERAVRMFLSRRNRFGLVSCVAKGDGPCGIVGWRNVIGGYRLLGATTELNSECYAALRAAAAMAAELDRAEDAREFEREADALKDAINEHLLDRSRNLYYLTLSDDGEPRRDVTCDLVFPVVFGVAERDVALKIIETLGRDEFWTDAGLRTVARDDVAYEPAHGHGLLGGVWGAPTFWFAAAAARYNPEYAAHALSAGFRHYAEDPARYATVPGQFCEWLHGETLTNQGMPLSPWFAPKYLWAALEAAAGLHPEASPPALEPALPPSWQWLGVRNAMLRGANVSWFAARCGAVATYATAAFETVPPERRYERDATDDVETTCDACAAIALARPGTLVVFLGNTSDSTVEAALRVAPALLPQHFHARVFDSLSQTWETASAKVARGEERLTIVRRGFRIVELAEEKR